MKKVYAKPEMAVYPIKGCTLLAGSEQTYPYDLGYNPTGVETNENLKA